MTVTVREFSPAGPCLRVGALQRETPHCYIVQRRDGEKIRINKTRVHIEPCRSCRDHPQTMYPKGHMD